jgi:hypothetical protein
MVLDAIGDDEHSLVKLEAFLHRVRRYRSIVASTEQFDPVGDRPKAAHLYISAAKRALTIVDDGQLLIDLVIWLPGSGPHRAP